MKKSILILFLAGLLIATSFHFVKAQDGTTDSREVIAREFNIPLDKVPTDREELQRMYLQKEWTKIITNNSVIGPIDKFLSKDNSQIAFKALFAHKYEISLTFFLILALWAFIWYIAAKLIESLGLLKGVVGAICGGLVAVILAQVRFIILVIGIFLDLIFKQLNWWTRTIIIVVGLGVFAFVYVILKMVEQSLKKKKDEKVKSDLEQEVKKVKALNEGVQGK